MEWMCSRCFQLFSDRKPHYIFYVSLTKAIKVMCKTKLVWFTSSHISLFPKHFELYINVFTCLQSCRLCLNSGQMNFISKNKTLNDLSQITLKMMVNRGLKNCILYLFTNHSDRLTFHERIPSLIIFHSLIEIKLVNCKEHS